MPKPQRPYQYNSKLPVLSSKTIQEKSKIEYPLEKRTFDFSKSVILLCRQIPNSVVSQNMIRQVLKSATSIGANYCEANGAILRKDFKNKIFTCKKEAQETLYWLRLISEVEPAIDGEKVINEAEEIVKIFGKISSTLCKD